MRRALLTDRFGAVDIKVATKMKRINVGWKRSKKRKGTWKAGFLPRVPLT